MALGESVLHWVAGAALTGVGGTIGWIMKLHNRMGQLETDFAKLEGRMMTRQEFKLDLQEHKQDVIRAQETITSTMNEKFDGIARMLERVERRLDERRDS